ncbi:MAG: hypothetical protein ACOZNI_30880 [Myxococcota bacterium]
MKDTPLPDLGPCADYPEGVYEYGEIGIGTCLAGPADLALLGDDGVLAVSNANPWLDFTGGSVTFLDLSKLDEGSGRNLVSDLAIEALPMPSFSGSMAVAAPHDLLLVANRFSEGARTRESKDDVWLVDVSDPGDPVLAGVGPDGDGTRVEVGWDPNALLYDPTSDLAYVVNRTGHDVMALDLGDDPVSLRGPGGDGSVEGRDFDDADATGSRAGFVTLDVVDEGIYAHDWDLRWSVGTLRAWVPTDGGARRMMGNGESLWEASAVPLDLDVEETDGEIAAVVDPSFLLEGDLARLFFVDDAGNVRDAATNDAIEVWSINTDDTLLEPREAEWDAVLGGPSVVYDDGTWYLFYDGGDGATQKIGLATSVDGLRFSRVGDEPIFSVDGVSMTDPFVFRDGEAAIWRMFYARDDGGIGQAESVDLTTWTARDEVFAPEGGAYAPAVAWYNGRFHLFTTRPDGDGWALHESVSIDGYDWEDVGVAFALDAFATPPRVALQVTREEAFRLEDETGAVFPLTLAPGDSIENPDGGWEIRVAAGHVADALLAGGESAELGSIAGDVAYATVTDEDGVSRIVTGTVAGDDLTVDGDVVIDPDELGVDGVSAPVVVADGSGWLMLFAREVDGVTSIGRATSADGLAWDVDDDPVLAAAADWESVAIEPGSVLVGDDGAFELWYAGYDGARWRVGVATSDDGEAFTRVAGPTYDWTFDAGGPGEWFDSGVRHPWVTAGPDGATYLWFSGDSGEAWQIGFAERASGDDDFTVASDAEGAARPVIASAAGGFGAGGVQHPVVVDDGDGYTLWYAGLDAGQARVGRAIARDPDRVHRDLRLPTLADDWGFTAIPAGDEDSIPLDVPVEGVDLMGMGCSSLAQDVARGYLFVGCKLANFVYVLDVRDDSDPYVADLNYMGIEAVIVLETSTASCAYIDSGDCSGLRDVLYDPARGWLFGVADEPEGIYVLDVTAIDDDGDADLVREEIRAILPLPRSGERDEGVDTQSYVGPGRLVLHPDGQHLFATNFNDNSVSVYDLALAGGTLVAQATNVGENPYAIRISTDGTRAYVANYSGEVHDEAVASTLVVLDADPTSPSFLAPLTWVVNK